MTKTETYRPRLYRESMGNSRWVSFRACHLETDLWIAVSAEGFSSYVETYSMERILYYRSMLNNHIKEYPGFFSSLTPVPDRSGVNGLLHDMYTASEAAGTGPMSAVAGAVAEYICNDLKAEFGFPEVVVENGGDIFLNLAQPATISVFAGSSPLSGKIGLIIKPEQTPVSVCCSSGTEGHSLSFGNADACVVGCRSGALADAYATACCNQVQSPDMIPGLTEMMIQKPGVVSVVIVMEDRVGIGGKIEITVLNE